MCSISRRQLILGAGAVVIAGGVAGGVEWETQPGRRERLMQRLGLSHGPDGHVPDSGARETTGILASRFTGASMAWTISTPGSGAAPAAVIVCLHGAFNDHRAAFDGVHVPDVASYVGWNVAVAAVDGGRDSYWHRRADGSDALRMLNEEFVPLVSSRLGALPIVLMGWSMGAYGALLSAERYPAGVVGIAAGSPALWPSYSASAPGAFDSAADFADNSILPGLVGLQKLPVALACGQGDPFHAQAVALAARLRPDIPPMYGPGLHDDAYWRSVAPGQLRSIRDALAKPR